jgi:DedD protein
MAKSISDEELQLRKRARRRLVGAIALVTIIAVFLPMVLDHEPKPVSQDVSIKIPSPDAGVFTSKIVPVVPAQNSAPAKPEAAAPAEPPSPKAESPKADSPKVAAAAAPAAKPPAEGATPPVYDTEAAPPKKAAPEKAASPVKSAEKPVAVEPVKAVEKPAEKTKAPAKGAAGYVVQVAALNDPDKAKQMRDQIAATGVKAYTEVVPTAKGNVTRVRGGPFASRAEADKARDKLKGIGLNGNVIPK